MKETKQRHKGFLRSRLKQYGVGYLFILPWAIGFGALIAFPLGWSFFMSFHKVVATTGGFSYDFVGLQNFKDAFVKDNVFPIQLIEYVQEMLLMIPIIVIFSLLVSLLLNQRFPGRFLFRAVFFLPVIFATGQVLTELFAQNAGEIPFMDQYNLEPIVQKYVGEGLAQPVLSVLGKTVIILWYSGVQILIYIAGYQTIPKSVYEAVRIDGATPWDSFWKITLPATLPFISLNTLYTIVDLFTFPMNPVLEHVRKNMFKPDTGYGYSSALAWIYFAFIFVLLAIVLRLFSSSAKRRGGRA
ncbi:carbohydrate ABC transporter permease [Cohnella nanjingensis]|uniref:Sugar ABC transporter permease n=1 Tax=Cohnella nanjingensis TaxID=1387779 RepID=A0A7X0RRE9_9BACL|nr:sugar ABC transporter permease [Cohnella nanjingensis]MBB6670879.1 sugar ABC transporter permease [Cohnella nanjingensis]